MRIIALLFLVLISAICVAEEQPPSWINTAPKDKGICGVGMQVINNGNKQLAQHIAATIARSEISKSISVHIEAVDESKIDSKKKTDEYTSYIKQFSNQILRGSAVVETWISSQNELYVLVCIDKASQEQSVKDIEKEVMEKLNQKVNVSIERPTKKK